jgi:hypothetical protein
MFVPFDNLHDQARLWIYQANRDLNSEELKIISEAMRSFTEGWLVHGQPMRASFDIRWNRFIILAADEEANAASGCSIDDSVRTLKILSAKLGLDFFDRTLITFKEGERIFAIPTTDLKSQGKSGSWNLDTLMFNNLVTTRKELDNAWIMPAGKTWLKRYLTQSGVAS